MIDTLFSRASLIARLLSGPVGPYLESYAQALLGKGYKRGTVIERLRAANAFSEWIERGGVPLSAVDDRIVARYVASFPRHPSQHRKIGRLPKIGLGMSELLAHLRECGAVVLRPVSKTRTDVERALDDYDFHLESALGLTEETRQLYARFVRPFLADLAAAGSIDWTALTAETVVRYVLGGEASISRSAHRLQIPAIRSFLRFLVFKGHIPTGLERAIPSHRRWKHASLPEHLTRQETQQAIDVWDSASLMGLRNRAVLLLLARLGLRAKVIRLLQLDNIDWRNGIIVLAAGKTRRERCLPLHPELGAALSAYIRDGRPPTKHRFVFLSLVPPFGPLQSSSAVSYIARMSLVRTGVTKRSAGAHLFRHSAATQMVRAGATFKEVADVLGHRKLETTNLYAKLDLTALSRVALPWPGGDQ